jgi:hypothetical protein
MIFGHAHPGAEVHFVNRDRRFDRALRAALLHPVAVVPGVVEVPHGRGRARRFLLVKAQRVGLVGAIAVLMRFDVVLVQGALADAGNESFPDSGTAARAQRVRLRMPMIEVADHRHFARVWRPDREAGAGLRAGVEDVRTQLVVDAVVAAFIEQVKIVFREQGNIVANGGGGLSRLTHRFSGSGRAREQPPSVPTRRPPAIARHARLRSSRARSRYNVLVTWPFYA